MRKRGKRGLVGAGLLAAAAATLAIVLTASDRDGGDVVSVRYVERRLVQEARRERTPLHSARCVRAQRLPRSFDCFAEGADDLHLAYRVRVARDGELVIRAPQEP